MTGASRYGMAVRIPTVENFGLYALHDQACAVCHIKHAVINCQSGVFQPCWSCQTSGWRTSRRRRWFMRVTQ